MPKCKPTRGEQDATEDALVERTCDNGHPLIKFYDRRTSRSECPLCALRREIAEVVVRVNTLEKACAEQIGKWRADERQTRKAQAMLVALEEIET